MNNAMISISSEFGLDLGQFLLSLKSREME